MDLNSRSARSYGAGRTRRKTTSRNASRLTKLRVNLLKNPSEQNRRSEPTPPHSAFCRRNRRGLLPQLLVLNGGMHLTAVDRDFLWGLNPQPDLVPPNFHHRDDDR